MEKLTDKQIKARAYYAKNAEKIKAQKRDSYNNTVNRIITPKSKSLLTIKVTEKAKEQVSLKHKPYNANGVEKENIPEHEDRKTSVRERIENIKLEKELESYWD
jgi:hypothetical protein